MKNSSIENRFCMSLVAFAVIVRLLLATGAAAAVDEAFGRAPQAQAPEPDILTLEILAAPEPIVPPEPEPQPEAEPEPASEPEPEPTYTPPVFSAEEADGIRIAGACSYTPDKQTLLLQPSSLDFQQDGPTVLIVHTHSSEAYTMEAGFEYPESDELRTQDSRYSVIRIGDEIAQILQDAGMKSCTTPSRTTTRTTTAPMSACARPSRAILPPTPPSRWCSTCTATRRRTPGASPLP